MKRMTTKWMATLVVLAVVFGFAQTASAETKTETINCPAGTLVGDVITQTIGDFTIVHTKTGTEAIEAASPWKMKFGNTITFTGNEAVNAITSVVITAKDAKVIDTSVGEINLDGFVHTITVNPADNINEFVLSHGGTQGDKQVQIISIAITYDAVAITTPTIQAVDKVQFWTPKGVEQVITLDVTALNLTEDITLTFDETDSKRPEFFSLSSPTIVAEGGSVDITYSAENSGAHNVNLVLSSAGAVSVTVQLKAKSMGLTGKGTEEDPYTCEDVIQWNNYAEGELWVAGYIIGATDNQSKYKADQAGNIVLSSEKQETAPDAFDATKHVTVQLLADTDIKAALNIVDHSENFGKYIKVKGSFENFYFGPGIKAPSDWKIIGESPTFNPSVDHIENVTFDGRVIKNYEHQVINVFNVSGLLMVTSTDDVNMEQYARGMYIVTSAKGSLKIVK